MIDRIKQLLDWQQLSPTQFADRIGVGRPVVSHILSERNKPSLEVVQRIIAAFPDLSLPWLLSGSGPMLAVPAPAAAPTLGAAAPIAAASIAAAPALGLPITPPLSTQRRDPAATALPAPEPERPASRPAGLQPSPEQRVASPAAAPPRFRTEAVAATPVAGATRFVAGSVKPTLVKPPVNEQLAPVAAFQATQEPSAAPKFPRAQALSPESTAEVRVAAAPAAPVAPAAIPAGAETLAQVLGESLGTPGKTIRRIVLFYADGSFADYKPE